MNPQVSGRRRKVAFRTLGCRLNQYETDAIATDFRRGGYEVVPFDSDADCYVVNTCTVTDRSDRKSRQLIFQTRRPGANPVVVVTGCFVERNNGFLEDQPHITYGIDNDHKYRIFDLVDSHFTGETFDLSELTRNRFGYSDGREGFHTRATVKIQDGCNNFCSFCIIPFVRGRAESRDAVDVLDQAKRTVDSGARELVLTGVNMGRYEHGEVTFVELIARILEIPGDFRLRLSSIEPDFAGSTEAFLDIIGHPRFCPHLHLCLQSGSERILLAMRRQYTAAEYRDLVEDIRKRHPRINFTTDVLVGFPGETEEDFDDTAMMARTVGFSHIHTFPYSPREGTPAARMVDQTEERVKYERAEVIRRISNENRLKYRESFIGARQKMLVERVDNGLHGYGEHYFPIVVRDNHESEWKNRYVSVRIDSIEKESNGASGPSAIGVFDDKVTYGG